MNDPLLSTSLDRSYVYAGHMAIRPEPIGLSAARRHVMRMARELALDRSDADDIVLAVGEALSNAYCHGTTDGERNLIYLGWHFADDVLTITVKDDGPGFSPFEMQPPRDGYRTRGFGMRIMRQSVDHVHFDWDDGAVVVLRKRVRPLRRRSGIEDTAPAVAPGNALFGKGAIGSN